MAYKKINLVSKEQLLLSLTKCRELKPQNVSLYISVKSEREGDSPG